MASLLVNSRLLRNIRDETRFHGFYLEFFELEFLHNEVESINRCVWSWTTVRSSPEWTFRRRRAFPRISASSSTISSCHRLRDRYRISFVLRARNRWLSALFSPRADVFLDRSHVFFRSTWTKKDLSPSRHKRKLPYRTNPALSSFARSPLSAAITPSFIEAFAYLCVSERIARFQTRWKIIR